ncbi:hypothetical protein BLNAU_13889 [Blattamonas nauphoetae]|uniref:Uncharacterized protein n=1 Tax=Blattamonas nauphoetae TaxID=2049346 RepID=A0ABQ9XGN1_9EUKA|nr:hypothetical protein BLNAU_13889 [Blattamonas nauphoetae]
MTSSQQINQFAQQLEQIYPFVASLELLQNMYNKERVTDKIYYETATDYMSRITFNIGVQHLSISQLETALNTLQLSCPYAMALLKNGIPQELVKKLKPQQHMTLVDAVSTVNNVKHALGLESYNPQTIGNEMLRISGYLREIAFSSQTGYAQSLELIQQLNEWSDKLRPMSPNALIDDEDTIKMDELLDKVLTLLGNP